MGVNMKGAQIMSEGKGIDDLERECENAGEGFGNLDLCSLRYECERDHPKLYAECWEYTEHLRNEEDVCPVLGVPAVLFN